MRSWPDDPKREDREARWEYRITWRYGALLLIAVGLLAMGFGASGLCTTAISAILVPIGFGLPCRRRGAAQDRGKRARGPKSDFR